MASKFATLAELSEVIASRSKIINDYLTANNLAQPTFVTDGPTRDYLPEDVDPEIRQARFELIDASQNMSDLALGVERYLSLKTVIPQQEASVQRTIHAFRLPQHVPLSGSISYHDLSQACGLEETRLRRVLGFAYLIHLFYEPKPDHVAHTAATQLLATSPDAMSFLGHASQDLVPIAIRQTDAFKKWYINPVDPSVEVDPTCCATSLAFDTTETLFNWWSKHAPERVDQFVGAMKFASQNKLFPEREVEDGFEWKGLGSGLVVDCGGSSGHVSVRLAAEFSNLRFVVQDLPEVVASAEKQAQGEGRKLMDQGRLEFQAHDFFQRQPVTDADVYFFRRILHDWPDHDCVRILKNLVPSMKKGSRIVINDFVLPEAGAISAAEEKFMRLSDLTMMTVLNAKERTLENWHEIFEEGGEGCLKFEYSKNSNTVCYTRL